MKRLGHDAGATDAVDAERARRGWLVPTVGVLFGLLYAYDLFEAISNLLGVVAQLDDYNSFATANGLEPAAVPWTLLIANIVLPILAFSLATWIGRRRTLGIRALLWFAGLAVVAALTLSLIALA